MNAPFNVPWSFINSGKSMEKQTYDLRELLNMIREQKQMNAEMALEFDCTIETEDIRPLIKVINYAINYISQLTDQTQQITLNASMSGITMSFSAFTNQSAFPAINPAVHEALSLYNARMSHTGQPGSHARLLIEFNH